MASIKYLEENNGDIFYPVTHERGVRDNNGVALSTKLAESSAIVNTLGSLVAAHDSAIGAVTSRESVVSWDGASTPVVANIPAGVEIEYDSDDYTGTLVASASTADKEYLVSDGNGNYDRYITINNGGTYSWIQYGTTEMDLSDYLRHSDEVWLTEAEWNILETKDPTKRYMIYEEEAIV